MNPLNRRSNSESKNPIRTNLMEILQALTSQTNDDHLVVAALKDMFQSNRVRLANSLAPLRLVEASVPARANRSARRRLH